MFDDIILSTSNHDEEWRIDRLNRILGYILAIENITSLEIINNISSLNDHEGTLTVKLKNEETFENSKRIIIGQAWTIAGNENAECIDFE